MGLSNAKPAAMKVERRIRWVDGENEEDVTPDRVVCRQKVVGRCSGGGGFKSWQVILGDDDPDCLLLLKDDGENSVVSLALRT